MAEKSTGVQEEGVESMDIALSSSPQMLSLVDIESQNAVHGNSDDAFPRIRDPPANRPGSSQPLPVSVQSSEDLDISVERETGQPSNSQQFSHARNEGVLTEEEVYSSSATQPQAVITFPINGVSGDSNARNNTSSQMQTRNTQSTRIQGCAIEPSSAMSYSFKIKKPENKPEASTSSSPPMQVIQLRPHGVRTNHQNEQASIHHHHQNSNSDSVSSIQRSPCPQTQISSSSSRDLSPHLNSSIPARPRGAVQKTDAVANGQPRLSSTRSYGSPSQYFSPRSRSTSIDTPTTCSVSLQTHEGPSRPASNGSTSQCDPFSVVSMSPRQPTDQPILRDVISRTALSHLDEIQDLDISLLCTVCQRNRVRILFLPCQHCICCLPCSANQHECPGCHETIVSKKNVSLRSSPEHRN